jgi:tetratricopeptide (TPR) repeat protein
VSAARFRVWVAAAYQHQPGEVDEVSRPLWTWGEADLAGILAALDGVRAVLSKGTTVGIVHVGEWSTTVGELREILSLTPAELLAGDISRLLKRGAILHTDIAASATEAWQLHDSATTVLVSSLHFGMAMDLVGALSLRSTANVGKAGPIPWRTLPDGPFVRSWYFAATAFLQARYEITSAPLFVDRALALFPEEPGLLLMAGGVHELIASPRVQEGTDIDKKDDVGSRDSNLRTAEARYRQALKADPGLVEAQVRLGRVLGLLGRHNQALTELQAAHVDDAAREMRYFRALFLGDEWDAVGNVSAARDAYQQALALYPDAQSAHLALSVFERRRDNREPAAASIRDLLEQPPTNQDDPWRQYYTAGDGRRATALLDALREPFRWRR